jgi:cytochrome oxidase Cu insertion factor (SCO1/SenC/PrrC family)
MAETAVKPRRLPGWVLPVFLVLAVGCLVASIVLPLPWSKRSSRDFPETPLGIDLPEFTMTERTGTPVSKADLKGKVWVASFVFVRCTGPCPTVTATMARLQADLDLANQPDLRLVTFTVDPDRDTPDELKKYAAQYRAHPDRWLFLTGKEDEIHRLAKEGFKIGVDRSTNPNPVEGQEFDHSTRLAVVDREGRVRGYFDGYRGPNDVDGKGYEESYSALKEAVRGLLAE